MILDQPLWLEDLIHEGQLAHMKTIIEDMVGSRRKEKNLDMWCKLRILMCLITDDYYDSHSSGRVMLKQIYVAAWAWQMCFKLQGCLVQLGSFRDQLWRKDEYSWYERIMERIEIESVVQSRLRDIAEAVLVRSGLNSVWLNQRYDLMFRRKNDNAVMIIYDFMTIPSWEDVEVGTPVPEPTPEEIVASQLDPKVSKRSKAPVKRKAYASAKEPSGVAKTKRKRKLLHKASEDVGQGNDLSKVAYCRYLESSLEKDEGISSRTASVQSLRSGKMLGPPPPNSSNIALSELNCVGTSNAPNAPSPFDGDVGRGTAPVDAAEGARMDKICRSSKHMDLFAESALCHDYEHDDLPSDDDFSFPTLVLLPISKRRMDHLNKLWSEFSNLKGKYQKSQEECRGHDQENKDLHASNHALSDEIKSLKDQVAEAEATAARSADEQALLMRDLENKLVFQESKTHKYKDMAAAVKQRFSDLRSDVTRFVSSEFDCLVQKFLCSDEFNVVLARILSLGINTAKFDKSVAESPSTNFPFLVKVSEVAGSTLPEVAKLQPNKLTRLVVFSSAPTTSSLSGKTFGRTSTLKDSEPKEFTDDVAPSGA
ncbi:hypothetical protein Tco_0901136 [Tanacetum coccineum]